VASATVGILRVLLTADTAEFDSAMKKASDTAKTWEKDLGSIGKSATAVGSALTKALTVPIVGLGGAAIKMAMDFESSFAGVRKTVDATEPEFAQLAQGLRNMAKEIPVNVNELNKVAEAAGQLGIKKDDILQFTRTMADLGVTTNLTAEEAATATAQIQNIFGAAGKDVDRFGATLVALGNAGASTEKDIIAMGLRIAGAGHQVGLTQSQVLAFASSLSSVGINAEAGGSAISRVFLKINDAVAVGGGAMAEFARVAGMSAAQFRTAFQTDAAGATTAFIEGLGQLKSQGENVNATLENLVGKNIILKDTLLRASGAGQLLREQLALGNQAWQENTALTREANERYKTFESQVKLLWAEIRDLGIQVGGALIPTFKDLIAIARPMVAQIGEAAKMFAELPQGVRATIIVVGALVAALGPMIFIFGQVALGAQAIIAAFTAKGIATRALTVVMTTATAQTGLFGMALTALGTTAGIAAAAFTGWQLGKWIGDITGATDAVGKMSAKLGEMIGLLPAGTAAQYDASRAAVAASQSAVGLAQAQTTVASATTGVATASAAAVPHVRAMAAATEESGKKAKDATRDYREFMNWVGERQMEAAGIAIAAMDAVSKSFQRGLLNLVPFKEALRSTGDDARLLASGLTEAGLIVTRSTEEMAEAARVTAEWVRQHGLLKGTIQQTGAVIESETPKWSSLFKTFADGIPNIILGAIQGGGDAIKSAGVFAGNELGTFMSTKFGDVLKAGLPFGLGSAINALLPSLGALLAPLAARLGSWLRNAFGGPSGEELAARGQVAAFEEELHGALTAQQELESQGEDWRRTVIAIRDAYIAAGRTEEEALRDAQRLWESSRDGGEEALRVIEEIRRKMQELTEDSHVIDIEYRTSAPPGTQIPGEPEHHTQPVDPGFPNGTMGRFGSWFKNFGSGFPTALHGVEAVLRPGDVAPFLQDAMNGGAAGAPGAVVNNRSVTVVPMFMTTGNKSSREQAKEFVRHLADTALPNDEGGITTELEGLFDNFIRSYVRG
jgi:TP901 family phage tail tape measure protein